MNTRMLGEARFANRLSHTISDDVRIPERIEIGADPGLQFELAGPREKLFFDAKKTRASIVTCGGLCPGLNNVIRSLFLELHYGYGVAEVIGFRGGYGRLDPKCRVEPVKITPAFVDSIHQHGHALAVVGVPKTIDNDVGFGSRTFGFFSAVDWFSPRGFHSCADRVARHVHKTPRSCEWLVGLCVVCDWTAGRIRLSG